MTPEQLRGLLRQFLPRVLWGLVVLAVLVVGVALLIVR
jgi:uncharacterized membrane protein